MIGSLAPGLRDLRVTPVSVPVFRVEVHATLLSAMLDGTFIHVPDYARQVQLSDGYAVSLVLLHWYLPIEAARLDFMSGAGGASVADVNLWAYVQAHVALPLAAAHPGDDDVCATHQLWLPETQTSNWPPCSDAILPPALVSEMVKPANTPRRRSQRELTIMFCDIHAFTRLAEHVDPQQVREAQTGCSTGSPGSFSPNHGTIDKYIGDCVMYQGTLAGGRACLVCREDGM